ncbi:MAG: hypothetical protein JWL77_7017 [Chthonomonadaceae bacterium]|nr:hypothetical protein [Chthonomonadaceae bacterium]
MAVSKAAATWMSSAVLVSGAVGVAILQLATTPTSNAAQPSSPTLGGGNVSSNGNNGNGNNAGHPITLTGSVVGTISLGAPATLNITISNPNNQDIVVTSVTGAITSVTSAGLVGRPVCSSNWYSVGSFTGSKTITKNANGQVSVPLTLTNLPSTNQDNCKGSTVHFSFTAQARQA